MKKKHTINGLQESILLLEAKQENEKALLKEQFRLSFDSLKPINLIKDVFEDLTNLSGLKGTALDASLSIATGYLSKKIVVGSSKNIFKNIFGSLVQVAVTSMTLKNADQIKSVASRLKTYLKIN
ncbi:MAG: hypothetical protein RBS19_01420 [Bacteroidales bacterium]|nr:hypothetical protein [Bacteroidales bacterium]